MEFLLECIGFGPRERPDRWATEAARRGEPASWPARRGEHRTLPLGGGLELRADRDPGESGWTLRPHYRAPRGLRIAVESLRTPPDSPGEAVLVGWTCASAARRRITRISGLLLDARRLPGRLPAGHVLAVGLAAFSVQVDAVTRDDGREPEFLPLLGRDDPGGCTQIASRVLAVERLENPLTENAVHRVDVVGPDGAPLAVFASPWQLFDDGLPAPAPGDRIEGTFLLSGRVTGGLPSVRRRVGAAFG